MRRAISIAVTCIALNGVALADNSNRSLRQQTNIPAEQLTSALAALANQFHFQLLYQTVTAEDRCTQGVKGYVTRDEALRQVLDSTGLTYRYLDEKTVTIVPQSPSANARGAAKDASGTCSGTRKETSKNAASSQTRGARAEQASEQNHESVAADAAGDAHEQHAPALEEIVVTATRHKASVQDVPLSITAFGQAAMQNLGITGIQDIARLTPGLTTSYANTGTTIISIRGISSTVGTSTTGIYIDDTPIQVRYIGAGTAASNAFPAVFDLDRIEVLRGPQGTLFGSGSEGGTVRFITTPPSLTQYSGHGRAEFSFNERGVPGYQFGDAAGGPLVPGQVGFRVSAYVNEDAGWIDLQPYPGAIVAQSNVNTDQTATVSGALTWAVTDALQITPSVFYQREHRGNTNDYWRVLSNPADDEFISGFQFAQPETDKFVLPSLKAEYKLPGVTLFSNTSYLDRTRDALADYTFIAVQILTHNFTGPNSVTQTYFNNPQKAFTQELRLQSSNPNSVVTWVVGGFYQDSRQKANEVAVSPTLGSLTEALFGATVPQVFGLDLLPGGIAYEGFDTSRDQQLAYFGQVDLKATRALTLTVGLRYSHTKFDYSNAQDGPFNGGPTAYAGNASENDTTPKYGVSYKLGGGALLYASASKGFRPGGGNAPVSLETCAPDLAKLGLTKAPTTFSSDHVWSYEAGSKGRLLAGRVQWDASAFYVDWTGIQSRVNLNTCGQEFIGNLGSAVSKGFDLQAQIAPYRGLTVETSLGYTDSRYAKTVLDGGTPQMPIVSKGELLPTPPWHAVVAVDYDFAELANERTPYLHVDDTYTSGYTLGNPKDVLYDPRNPASYSSANELNTRVGLKAGDWDVALFCKNMLNAHAVYDTIHANSGSDLFLDQALPPRVFGVTANYWF
jgi:iron complex outermembrane recepter protein